MIRTLDVPGQPVGKGRPRFTRSGHAYTPAKTANVEKLIRNTYRMRYGSQKYEKNQPVFVSIIACYKVPASDSRKVKQRKLTGAIQPTIKPDLDNVGKLVMDALNGVAYEDDKQVVALIVRKIYTEKPRIIIRIADKEGESLPEAESGESKSWEGTTE